MRTRTGAAKLNRLTGPTCIEFRDELLKRLSRKNAAKVLTSFKSALGEMRSRGLLSTDPAEDVSIVDSSRRRERLVVSDEDRVGHIPSPDQLGRILAAADLLAKANDQRTAIAWRRYRALAYTMAFSGLRMSELRGLPWPNYEAGALTIRVTQRAEKMDHADVTVTLQIYGHLFPDEEGQRPARASAMGADLIRRRQRAADATRMQHRAAEAAENLSLDAD